MSVNIDHKNKKKKKIKTAFIINFRYLHELCHYSEVYPGILVVFVVIANGFQALNMVKEFQLRCCTVLDLSLALILVVKLVISEVDCKTNRKSN